MKIQLLSKNPQRNKSQSIYSRNHNQDLDQDYNQQEDKNTLSFWQNFREAKLFYFSMFVTLFSLTLVYPVLMFRIDLTGYVSLRYKYIYLNFLYTCGELSGKVLHLFYKVREKRMLIKAVGLRVFAALAVYFVSDASSLLSSDRVHFLPKTLVCLFQGFSMGYVFNMILDIGQLHFKGRPYDALKYGQIIQFCLQIGTFLGSAVSSLL